MKVKRVNVIIPTQKPILRTQYHHHQGIVINKRADKQNTPQLIKKFETASFNVTLPNEQQRLDGTLQELNQSYSIDQISNEQEKQLFWKLLSAKNTEWLQIYQQLTHIKIDAIISFVKIGQDDHQIQSNKIISHFIGMYLLSMGYDDMQVKARLLKNISLAFRDNQTAIKIGQRMYDSLLHEYLPPEIQLKALLLICQKGWQYFWLLICKIIKILSKKDSLANLQEIYSKLESSLNV